MDFRLCRPSKVLIFSFLFGIYFNLEYHNRYWGSTDDTYLAKLRIAANLRFLVVTEHFWTTSILFKKSDIMFNVKSSILSLETTSPFDFIKLNN